MSDLEKSRLLVLQSINLMLNQCHQALEDTENLKIPNLSSEIENIVVPGMGGSAFTPDIVKSLFFEEIKLPYEILRSYHLPGYVNKRSLVILSSYSGTTEEVLNCAEEAVERGAKILVISCGGKLKELAKKYKWSGYFFEPNFNPSGQPRLGIGYMVCGHIGLLIKSGLINLKFSKVKNSLKNIKNLDLIRKEAKNLALKLKNKFVILVASSFLEGAVHGFANQLNESAKTHSTYHFIPELNHHRMEGLVFPKEFKKTGIFLFYLSALYDPKIAVRFKITKNVIEKNGFEVLTNIPVGEKKIAQCFETILFNSYVSYYLAELNEVDPIKIPWVDYFKEQLRKVEK
jgi:glucose/mannose-6-phosphate isomerase